MKCKLNYIYSIAIVVLVFFLLPTAIYGQTQSLQFEPAKRVSASMETTVNERGQFRFVYSYSGQPVGATLTITNNGVIIGQQIGLVPVTDAVLADVPVEQGDVLVFRQEFKDDTDVATLTPLPFGHPAGFWYSFGSGAFFTVDQSGNVLEFFGSWESTFTLTPPWNALELGADPSSILQGEASTVNLLPIEAPDTPVLIPDETRISVQTDLIGQLLGGLSLPEFGFRYIAGFTANYSIIANTTIEYEALPDSSVPSVVVVERVPVQITANSPFNTTINGNTVVEIMEEEDLTISLDLFGPDTAWPTPRMENGVDNVIENIVATVTKSTGEPAPNQSVEIEAVWVSGSGGHSHPNVPPQDQMGVLSVLLPVPLAPEQGRGVIEAETDEEGKIYLNYTTPQFGGNIDLVATLQTTTGQSNSKRVTARVPGLVELTSGQNYELIGAPDNNSGTNDPCRLPPGSNHYSNHWGVPALAKAVKSIAAEFDSLYPGTKLRINDVSLENGGLFDYKNNWSPPHKSHRTGTNADIGFKAIGPNGQCKEDTNLKILRTIIINLTGRIPLRETTHYHIYSN